MGLRGQKSDFKRLYLCSGRLQKPTAVIHYIFEALACLNTNWADFMACFLNDKRIMAIKVTIFIVNGYLCGHMYTRLKVRTTRYSKYGRKKVSILLKSICPLA